jgi:penicillin-binding protein 1B
MTPIDVAAGYTTFATMGTRAEPQFLHSVVGADGSTLEKFGPQTHMALDSRVTYLVDSILMDVLNHGTGAAVRARGFTLPAAGKTGTSRDGWFAGFTSNLVCVIWIGFDDNRDLGLTGGASAAPVWADFMIRATALPAYKDVKELSIPEGVQSVVIDPESLELATPNCPTTRAEVYVAGSAPTQLCELHGGHGIISSTGSFLSHIFGGGGQDKQQLGPDGKPIATDPNRPPADPNRPPAGQVASDPSVPGEEKKKNPLQKIFGIFGGKKKDSDKAKAKPEKGDPP